jgi:glycyl-tRNA synthetase beta chain
VVDDVIDFMLGRFRAWYQDEGYTVDTIQAVLARRPTRPADFDARMKAVSHFRTLEAASALAAANKRVSNILAKSDETLNERERRDAERAGRDRPGDAGCGAA